MSWLNNITNNTLCCITRSSFYSHRTYIHSSLSVYDSLLKQLKLCFNELFKYNDNTPDLLEYLYIIM